MFEKIKKRDGRIIKFDPQKISWAIQRAGEATGEFGKNTVDRLTLEVLALAEKTIDKKVPGVEDIQNIVEEVLLSSRYKETAKVYILYRDQRRRLREIVDTANVGLFDQYLERLDWQVNENSNMSYSLQGLNNYVYSEVSKVYWLNKVYTSEIREAQLRGDFHIHDLSVLSVYCVGWDLVDLLTRGFGGVSGKIESKPPKHLRSALGQVINFFYTLQNEAAGAQAFSSFDTLLAPFIRYDGLSERGVRQAIQEFLFNINVPTRVGFQTPFTNVTLDLTVPKIYANEKVIIGGERKRETYKEFQKELNLFNRVFLELMAEGDAHSRVFTFPIPTYNIASNFDWDNKNMDVLWEVTAKYGIPYFSNFINSDLNPEDARSMCCRLRIDHRSLEKRGGGLFGANPLTGSIGVVTVNMPRIGFLAGSEEDFFARLARIMIIAKDSLEMKRKILEKFTEGGLYPYSRNYLRSVKERMGSYWSNHFSTVGLVGMNEACLNFLGVGIANEEGNQFAQKVLDFMGEKLSDFHRETGNKYNLEATPAESTAYRLAKKDKEIYPDIICANEDFVKSQSAEPFYTNSTHLPVYYTEDIFETLDLQDPLQVKYTGGTVVHIYVGEKIEDIKVVKSLVKTVCHKYRLPYFTLTPTFSVCSDHGYLSGEHFNCPKCAKSCEVYSRIVGYLRPVSQWNKGKQEEYALRKPYKIAVKAGV